MILQLKNVSHIYHSITNETIAVEDVSFSVEEGEFFGIVGPSGCGKTTILGMLAGLLKPSTGEILLKGKPLDLKNRSTALMPQNDRLFEWRTIEKNVLLGLEIMKNKTDEKVENARVLLKKYGLWEFRKKKPAELSGGMRQRAALIRTLVTTPDLLLLDEPFSALDYQTRLNVCNDVYSIIREEKKTAVLVTHDLGEAISMCDKIALLSTRPARIKQIVTVNLDKSLTPLKRRECDGYSHYFDLLWRQLEGDENVT